MWGHRDYLLIYEDMILSKQIENRSVKEFIDTEYKDYSMYVLQNRAIPSAIDGFKPVQRKLVYALSKKNGKVKVAELGGSLSSYGYLHGETSAQSAAIALAAPWNNNAGVFDAHGNFGSRLITDAAAPRYIYTSMAETFRKYFVDTEVAPENPDSEHPEPLHYLPVIPWVLVNGVKGIAVGYATNILPRSVKDVVNACKQYLSGKKVSDIDPTFPDFKGTVEKTDVGVWSASGIVELNRQTYTISELPPGVDRETYINMLNKYCDEGKIQDYDDYCDENGFKFKVKVARADLSKINKDPMKFFKLTKSYSENLTTIGHDGTLQIFDTVADLVKYFCDYRLDMFQVKIKSAQVENSDKLRELQDRMTFIQKVVDKEIDFGSVTKDRLEDIVSSITDGAPWTKSIMRIPVYEATADSVSELQGKIKAQSDVLDSWNSMTPGVAFGEHLNGKFKL